MKRPETWRRAARVGDLKLLRRKSCPVNVVINRRKVLRVGKYNSTQGVVPIAIVIWLLVIAILASAGGLFIGMITSKALASIAIPIAVMLTITCNLPQILEWKNRNKKDL